MNYKISHSSEAITSFMQGKTIDPRKKFEAIQNDKGNSMLFYIETDGAFYVNEEQSCHLDLDIEEAKETVKSQLQVDTGSGKAKLSEEQQAKVKTAYEESADTGWLSSNLSDVLKADFPADSTFEAKTFAISQDAESSAYSAVLAVTVAGIDHLYMASAYSRDEQNNLGLAWTPLPFDGTVGTASSLNINGIGLFQNGNSPLVVVDITLEGKSTIERYYIDQNSSSQKWIYYPLPTNMSNEDVEVCIGKRKGDFVNGIYSCGMVGSTRGVYYQEVPNSSNPDESQPASQFYFRDCSPSKIAVTSSKLAGRTDLYVTTEEGDLLVFFADNQKKNSEGIKIMSHDLFKSTENLFAYSINSKVVVWGLNRNQEIFYTECGSSQLEDSAKWSYPLALKNNIQQISPYINKVNGGNTYFANLGNKQLKKFTQDPVSTCWLSEDILLPVPLDSEAQNFDCYMTRITITDETNTLVANAKVRLSAKSRTPVFINNRYYVLDSSPIDVLTDLTGGIKIVQRIESLQGTVFFLENYSQDKTLEINPMNAAVSTLAELSDPEELKTAKVVSDSGKETKSLTGNDLTDSDYEVAAESIQSLVNAYNNYDTSAPSTDSSAKKATAIQFSKTPNTGLRAYSLAVSPQYMNFSVVDSMDDFADAIIVKAGDLCSWLANATEYVINIVENISDKIWNFVVTIAGEVFTFVVDTIEKAIEAIATILQALKVLVKDIIQFVKFLFSWDDITRTKDVIKNSIKLYLDSCLESVQSTAVSISETLESASGKIDDWAGIPNDDNFGNQPLSSSQSEVANNQLYSTPNTYLLDHLNNNILHSQFKNAFETGVNIIEDAIRTFVDACKAEFGAIKEIGEQIYDEILKDGKFKTMSFVDIIKKLVAITLDFLLETADIFMNAIVQFISDLYEELMAYFDKPIWIPVVSNILEVFNQEIDLSLLDIFCYVGAIPGTIVYKGLYQEAPFPENDPTTNKLINSTSLAELNNAFGTTPPDSIDFSEEFYSAYQIPQKGKNTIFIISHITSSMGALVSAVLQPIASLPTGSAVATANSIASAVQSVGFVAGGSLSIPYPMQNETVSSLSSYITDAKILSSVILGIMGKKNSLTMISKDLTGISAITLSMLAVAPLGFHFYEVASGDQNKFTALSYMNDSAKLSSYLATIAGGIATLDPKPTTKEAMAIAGAVCALVNGGIQVSSCVVDTMVE